MKATLMIITILSAIVAMASGEMATERYANTVAAEAQTNAVAEARTYTDLKTADIGTRTNEVRAIINAETGGTNTLVHADELDLKADKWNTYTRSEVDAKTNGFLRVESDPTVPDWAKAENPPQSMTDNAVILTNATLKTKDGSAVTAANVGAVGTNDVREIVDAETGGTNTIAHYATAAWTNGVAEVVTNGLMSDFAKLSTGSVTIENNGNLWFHGSDSGFHPTEYRTSFGPNGLTYYTKPYGSRNYSQKASFGNGVSLIGGSLYIGSSLLGGTWTSYNNGTITRSGITEDHTLTIPSDSGTIALTKDLEGLQSMANAYLMETNAPLRYSSFVSEGHGVICPRIFFSLNPVLLNLLNVPTELCEIAIITDDWPESKGLFAKITVPASYAVADNIVLLGYGAWPTSCTFQAYVWRCGEKYYVNIMSILED